MLKALGDRPQMQSPLHELVHTPRALYSEPLLQERVVFMAEVSFSDLVESLVGLPTATPIGTRLQIAAVPSPFVKPTLHSEKDTGPFGSEIIMIEAGAAVGKSTIANFLSGSLNIPILDLAKVPVSTGSLKGLLLDVKGVGDPIAAFHAGKLPIIVDALDEGRLRSNEHGFDSFLQTTAEFLGEDRTVKSRPKLIFFGRFESTSLADTGLEMYGDGLSVARLQVGFFEEASAWELITAYAEAEAEPNATYRRHQEPARQLIALRSNRIGPRTFAKYPLVE